MHRCSGQRGAYRAAEGCDLSPSRNFARSPLRVLPTKSGILRGRPGFMIRNADHDHHAREVRNARWPGLRRVPLPRLLLHLRPQ
jgi:hypothetical protein